MMSGDVGACGLCGGRCSRLCSVTRIDAVGQIHKKPHEFLSMSSSSTQIHTVESCDELDVVEYYWY